MYEHHRTALEAVTRKLGAQEDVFGVILTGSVAHGYAIENSDVDIFIVYADDDYRRRLEAGDISYFDTDSADYEGGYIDGKATSAQFIREGADRGSEPARYAFKDALVTFDRLGGLGELVKAAARYPEEHKTENIAKFYAQFQTWRWYYYEALKRGSRYLTETSVINYVLFAGRLMLAYNETLYPGHKWFMRELAGVKRRPEGLISCINGTLEQKKAENVEKLYNLVTGFIHWPDERLWSVRYILDSEIGWYTGVRPPDEL